MLHYIYTLLRESNSARYATNVCTGFPFSSVIILHALATCTQIAPLLFLRTGISDCRQTYYHETHTHTHIWLTVCALYLHYTIYTICILYAGTDLFNHPYIIRFAYVRYRWTSVLLCTTRTLRILCQHTYRVQDFDVAAMARTATAATKGTMKLLP